MAEQGRGDDFQEQDWLSLGIQVIINNSPGTAGKHWNYSGFCIQTTVFDPQDSALTQKKLRREFSRVCPIGIHAILPRQF